jgi:hypothetical protein
MTHQAHLVKVMLQTDHALQLLSGSMRSIVSITKLNII